MKGTTVSYEGIGHGRKPQRGDAFVSIDRSLVQSLPFWVTTSHPRLFESLRLASFESRLSSSLLMKLVYMGCLFELLCNAIWLECVSLGPENGFASCAQVCRHILPDQDLKSAQVAELGKKV